MSALCSMQIHCLRAYNVCDYFFPHITLFLSHYSPVEYFPFLNAPCSLSVLFTSLQFNTAEQYTRQSAGLVITLSDKHNNVFRDTHSHDFCYKPLRFIHIRQHVVLQDRGPFCPVGRQCQRPHDDGFTSTIWPGQPQQQPLGRYWRRLPLQAALWCLRYY